MVSTLIPPYVYPGDATANVQPWTMRDGMSAEQRFRNLLKYINLEIVPFIQTNVSAVATSFETEVNKLIADVNEALLSQDAEVDTKLLALTTYVDAQVEAIINNSITVTDPMMRDIVNNPVSLTRIALNAIYQAKGTVDDEAVAALIDDENSDTRDSLDNEYGTVRTVAQGGTGRATAGVAYGVVRAGATITAPHETVAPGTAGRVLRSNGAGAAPSFDILINDADADGELDQVYSSTKTREIVNGKILRNVFAARPAANTVPVNTLFIATDVPEMYVSDGAAWNVTGSSGQELGYAEQTALFNNANTAQADVPGLTVTFIAGARPARFYLSMRTAMSVTTSVGVVSVELDGSEIARLQFVAGYADEWETHSVGRKLPTMTPGTTHTLKVRLARAASGTGTARTAGDLTNPNNLEVVTV